MQSQICKVWQTTPSHNLHMCICTYTYCSFIPPNDHGKGIIPGSRVYSPNNDLHIVDKLLGLPNIQCAKPYALFIGLIATKDQLQDTFMFTDNLNNLYLCNKHICHPSSQHKTHITCTDYDI